MSLSKRTRNAEVLESFVAYCQRNPEQRFWQALRNWSGHNFIYVSKHQAQEFADDAKAMEIYSDLEETFYWESKNGR